MRAAVREFVFAAAADERRELANLLDGLDEAQLATPSLCAGWDVKTVAAHVVSTVTDGTPAFVRLALRRGSLSRAIDELARRGAQGPVNEIAARLRGCADRRISPPLFGPLDPLADILVHGGDIRVPLGLPFEPDPRLVALAMDFLSGPWPLGFVPLGRLRGISLRADDIGQVWGSGAEIRGPVVALMMAVSGRTALLDLLDGPGLAPLCRRLSGRRGAPPPSSQV
ncbi:maleylpyruvate isomerase family mycothiol-dependent enzyme [Mycobacterium sp. 663a-19]|uniref:maleylpyruvate isomerase family mycothiol-dependent enzyme n=1 Tax=Mycobacterium sp. 663a-19 TaxID=2986148 RepID=UPI002D1F2D50|nr:maleylpyruvate isomerase family mycothiol-dependent enzyme [Mycobacterium sp. 663a-19]MEB3981302.1 maleylpyruvate isomerase family mycothiol-dependent enzyme [Mycobacterium sp. 663a-19]